MYSLEVTNMYARAYEERILTLRLEEDQERYKKDLEKKTQEGLELELKRRMNEFYRSMASEDSKRKERRSNERNLEDHARQASVAEHEEILKGRVAALRATMEEGIRNATERLELNVKQSTSKSMEALKRHVQKKKAPQKGLQKAPQKSETNI